MFIAHFLSSVWRRFRSAQTARRKGSEQEIEKDDDGDRNTDEPQQDALHLILLRVPQTQPVADMLVPT
jgi:hypothetical protein